MKNPFMQATIQQPIETISDLIRELQHQQQLLGDIPIRIAASPDGFAENVCTFDIYDDVGYNSIIESRVFNPKTAMLVLDQ